MCVCVCWHQLAFDKCLLVKTATTAYYKPTFFSVDVNRIPLTLHSNNYAVSRSHET